MSYQDITLFNRYIIDHNSVYQRTYLYKVEWTRPRAVLGSPPNYSYLIKIPMVDSLYYLPQLKWKNLMIIDGYWTLQLEDMIVRGVVDIQIGAVTNEEENIFTLTDLKKREDIVTIVDLDTDEENPISQLMINVGAS